MQRCIELSDIAAAERTRPTIGISEASLAADRGRLSGYAESCLMDWYGRNFTPMMAYFRARRLGERQLAYLSCVHDQVRSETRNMNNTFAGLGAHSRCDASLARALDFRAPRDRGAASR